MELSLIEQLRQLKPEITDRYKVKMIGVFGSYARSEQTAGSDIDLLVDFADDADLFDLVGLNLYLEDRLQQKVDIVSRKALRAELRATILAQVIPL